ncbi:hypothetical protein MNBD_GAMMA08-3053 [hydrothermal vent metagenome]|uniref:Uncharacterized protein n=1 Tax=hydrothermal vent metagenome TaxID=652676 RepID=A0A3B0XX42_9ZZZZ
MSDRIEFGATISAVAAKNKALRLIGEFSLDKSIAAASTHYPNIRKASVVKGLKAVINQSEPLAQKFTSLCGPAAFFFNITRSRPDIYTQAVLDLYKKGRAQLKNLKLESSAPAKTASLGPSRIRDIDWMIMSSIKSSWYEKPEDDFSAITWAGDLLAWLRNAGYQALDNTSYVGTQGLDNLLQAQNAYASGHDVFLFVNGKIFQFTGKHSSSSFPNHWAVLNSNIKISQHDKTSGQYKAPVPLSGPLLNSILQEWQDYDDAIEAFEENGGFEAPVKTSNLIALDAYTWGEPNKHVFGENGASQKAELHLFLNHYFGFIKAKR